MKLSEKALKAGLLGLTTLECKDYLEKHRDITPHPFHDGYTKEKVIQNFSYFRGGWNNGTIEAVMNNGDIIQLITT